MSFELMFYLVVVSIVTNEIFSVSVNGYIHVETRIDINLDDQYHPRRHNAPTTNYRTWKVQVKTCDKSYAGTDAYVKLRVKSGNMYDNDFEFKDTDGSKFERNKKDLFEILVPDWVTAITGMSLYRLQTLTTYAAWCAEWVKIKNDELDICYTGTFGGWITATETNNMRRLHWKPTKNTHFSSGNYESCTDADVSIVWQNETGGKVFTPQKPLRNHFERKNRNRFEISVPDSMKSMTGMWLYRSWAWTLNEEWCCDWFENKKLDICHSATFYGWIEVYDIGMGRHGVTLNGGVVMMVVNNGGVKTKISFPEITRAVRFKICKECITVCLIWMCRFVR